MFTVPITIIVGTAGGLVGKRLRMPAGAMTGAVIAVSLYSILTNHAAFPVEYKTYLQFLSGALIGVKLCKDDIIALKKMGKPCIVQIVSMLLLNIVFGVLMHYYGKLDLVTAFFCSAPAGMSDMALIAGEYGADSRYVTIVQLMRVVSIVTFMPTFYKVILRRKAGAAAPVGKEREKKKIGTKASNAGVLTFVITISTAVLGGLTFKYIGIKAGALIGAIAAVTCLSITTKYAYMPRFMKTAVQIGAGAYIGAQMTRESLVLFSALYVPILIMIVGMFGFVYFSAVIMQKISGLDFLSCLLISTPGGMQEMTLMAQDFECDASKVVLLHVIRIMSVIFLFTPLLGEIGS